MAAEISKWFGFSAGSLNELVNDWTKRRPDLLIGAFHPDRETLTIIGEGVALDPECSRVMRDAARQLGIARARRILIHGAQPDVWTTDVQCMRGRVPTVLYHGTSDVHLDLILRGGLRTDQSPNWERAGRSHVYITATPQTAAFHARRTAGLRGGNPIVLACRKPWSLHADWDVENQLVRNLDVPSRNAAELAREAGLFATRRRILPTSILEVLEPELSVPAERWMRRHRVGGLTRALSLVWR